MRGNQKNKDYKAQWTPQFAYAIGLLTTDGNLSKDGRHIEFTSKDIQLVKTFRKCISLTNVKIGTKTSGTTDKKYFHIQFSNVILYKKLLEIGLTPNKSKTLRELKIPNKYFFDFLRGHLDGDGCYYSYWDKRWNSSFMFYTVFTSASEQHINWLHENIKKLINIEGSISENRNRDLWQLRYAKNSSKAIIKKIYYKKNLPCLKRKYIKLKNILKIDDKENCKNNADVAQLARRTGLRLLGDFSPCGFESHRPHFLDLSKTK